MHSFWFAPTRSHVNACTNKYSKDTVEERDEQAEFETGPLSVLMQSVKQNTQVCTALLVYEILVLSRFLLNLSNSTPNICTGAH